MKLNVQKFKDGGQSKKVEATFGLPEVNIYPQNEFGDIARSQGINRARNWKKVKEGTTKGINDFYNDPRTQIVMAGLPLPSMLDAAGDGIKLANTIISGSKVGQISSKMSSKINNYAANTKIGKKIKNIINDTNGQVNDLLTQDPIINNSNINNTYKNEIKFNEFPKKYQGNTSYKFYERPIKNNPPKLDKNKVNYKSNPFKDEVQNTDVNLNLIHRSKELLPFENGNLRWNSKKMYYKDELTGKPKLFKRSTHHFTTDQPVIDHSAGTWSDASETMIVPYRDVVKQNGFPVNAEPMDTFFYTPTTFNIPGQNAKILTGNKINYYKYKQMGINAEYSKESSEILRKIKDFTKKYGDVDTSNRDAWMIRDELHRANDKIHREWAKQNTRIEDYDNLKKETNVYTNTRDENGKVKYHSAPSTHANMIYGSTEVDPSVTPMEFKYGLENYPEISGNNKDMMWLQGMMQTHKLKTPLRVGDHLKNSEKVNKILNGEILYRYKNGGNLNRLAYKNKDKNK